MSMVPVTPMNISRVKQHSTLFHRHRKNQEGFAVTCCVIGNVKRTKGQEFRRKVMAENGQFFNLDPRNCGNWLADTG